MAYTGCEASISRSSNAGASRFALVAVEGTVAPYVAGEEAPPEMFLAAVTPDDRDFVERMELALATAQPSQHRPR